MAHTPIPIVPRSFICWRTRKWCISKYIQSECKFVIDLNLANVVHCAFPILFSHFGDPESRSVVIQSHSIIRVDSPFRN